MINAFSYRKIFKFRVPESKRFLRNTNREFFAKIALSHSLAAKLLAFALCNGSRGVSRDLHWAKRYVQLFHYLLAISCWKNLLRVSWMSLVSWSIGNELSLSSLSTPPSFFFSLNVNSLIVLTFHSQHTPVIPMAKDDTARHVACEMAAMASL